MTRCESGERGNFYIVVHERRNFAKLNVTKRDSPKVGSLRPAVLERSLRSLKERLVTSLGFL